MNETQSLINSHEDEVCILEIKEVIDSRDTLTFINKCIIVISIFRFVLYGILYNYKISFIIMLIELCIYNFSVFVLIVHPSLNLKIQYKFRLNKHQNYRLFLNLSCKLEKP